MADHDDTVGITYYFGAKQQLEWAPALANGAAVLALASIVAGASDQDAALTGLTIPLAIFGAGLCTAVFSLQLSFLSFSKKSFIADTMKEIHDIAGPLIARFNAAPINEKVQMAPEMLALKPKVETAQPKLVKAMITYKLSGWLSTTLGFTSILLCVLGFTTLLVGHSLGYLRLS
jgi:mannose/fructose/N-acetylgalactosamine-specific phosphotransferase system component IIC